MSEEKPVKEVPEWKKKPVRKSAVMVCCHCRRHDVTLRTVSTKKGNFLFCVRCVKIPNAVKSFVDSLTQADA